MVSKTKKLQDSELLYLASENNEDAASLLIDKYRNCILNTLKEYLKEYSVRGMEIADLYQEGLQRGSHFLWEQGSHLIVQRHIIRTLLSGVQGYRSFRRHKAFRRIHPGGSHWHKSCGNGCLVFRRRHFRRPGCRSRARQVLRRAEGPYACFQ